MSSLLIRNARVLQMQDHTPSVLDHQDILIKDNHIEAIYLTGQVDASHFDEVVEANGQLAMPGLINTHAHVPMVIFRGLAEDVNIDSWFNDYIWLLEMNLTPEDVYWGMQLGLLEMIEAGVTAVADHYWHMDYAAQAVEKAGTRALLGQAMFSGNGMQQIDETGEFVKRWQGAANGRITTIMAPHAPYTCDDGFLHAAAQKAKELDVGIHIHVAETMGQTQASLEQRGLTPVQVLEQTGALDVPTILAHVIGATPSDIEILASHATGIAHCPKTYFKLGMGYAPVLEFREAGIPIGLGTDGAVSNNTLDIWESMRLMAMGQKQRTGIPENLTIADALTIATKESARVYGQSDDLGEIASGKLADIILVDLNGIHHQPLYSVTASLVYNLRADDVQTVIVDGKIIMKDRQHLTLDKDEIITHITNQMPRLAQRKSDQRLQAYNP